MATYIPSTAVMAEMCRLGMQEVVHGSKSRMLAQELITIMRPARDIGPDDFRRRHKGAYEKYELDPERWENDLALQVKANRYAMHGLLRLLTPVYTEGVRDCMRVRHVVGDMRSSSRRKLYCVLMERVIKDVELSNWRERRIYPLMCDETLDENADFVKMCLEQEVTGFAEYDPYFVDISLSRMGRPTPSRFVDFEHTWRGKQYTSTNRIWAYSRDDFMGGRHMPPRIQTRLQRQNDIIQESQGGSHEAS